MIEALEAELKTVQARFDLLEEELTEAQDAKDAAQKATSDSAKLRVRLEAEAEELRERVEQLVEVEESGAGARAALEEALGENRRIVEELEEVRRVRGELGVKLKATEIKPKLVYSRLMSNHKMGNI